MIFSAHQPSVPNLRLYMGHGMNYNGEKATEKIVILVIGFSRLGIQNDICVVAIVKLSCTSHGTLCLETTIRYCYNKTNTICYKLHYNTLLPTR